MSYPTKLERGSGATPAEGGRPSSRMRMLATAALLGLLGACSDDTGGDPGDSRGEMDVVDTTGRSTDADPSAPTSTDGAGETVSASGAEASSASTTSTGSDPMDTDTDTDTDPSGGAESSSGDSPGASQGASTQITYRRGATTESVRVDDCTFCDATLMAPDLLLLRYQQARGWTIWSLYVPLNATAGELPLTADFSGAYMNLSETSPAVSEPLQGYFDPTMVQGGVTLSVVELSPGGRIEGTLSAELVGEEVTATFTSEFFADIP